MSLSNLEFKEKVKKNRKACFCGELFKVDKEGNLYCPKCDAKEEVLTAGNSIPENALKDILQGKKIMLFSAFPIDYIPKMKPIIIEKLNDEEQKMYEKKAYYMSLWKNIENWSAVKKFLVSWAGEIFLVRFV